MVEFVAERRGLLDDLEHPALPVLDRGRDAFALLAGGIGLLRFGGDDLGLALDGLPDGFQVARGGFGLLARLAQLFRQRPEFARAAVGLVLELADALGVMRDGLLGGLGLRADFVERVAFLEMRRFEVRHLRFDGLDQRFHLRQFGGQRGLARPERADSVFDALALRLPLQVVLHRDREHDLAQARGVFAVALGLGGLVLDRAQLLALLFELHVHLLEVDPRAFEPALRLAPLRLVAADAGGFLEDHPAFLGVRLDEPLDLALLDDAVGVHADAGIHEELADVAEAAGLAVEEVFGLAAAVEAARDADLGVLAREHAAVVEETQAGLGVAERAAGRGAAEDHFGHLRRADGAGALLAQDPAHRVHDVALAAAVRPDERRDAGAEIEFGLVRERLEPAHLQLFEQHAVSLSLVLSARSP